MFCADELDDCQNNDNQLVLSDMPSEDLEQLGRELNEETPSGQPETEPRDMEALLETTYNLDQLVQDIMEAK
jgi:hypothetical protein